MAVKNTRKPLDNDDGEMKDRDGSNLILCVPCESNEDIPHSYQAIAIVRGFSVCREHLISWETFGTHDIPSTN